MKRIILGISLFLSFYAHAKEEIILEGYPIKKYELMGEKSVTHLLNKSQSEEYKILIVKRDDTYFWVSRGNIPVIPIESGSYITYVSSKGPDYIRVFNPSVKALLKQLSHEQQNKEFTYMEHLVFSMGSITYYGR